jgi:hypothetical protein
MGQDEDLVAEVEARRGLVQQKDGGLLHQRTGDHAELALAAADAVEAALRKVGNAHLQECPLHPVLFRFARGPEGGKARGGAHEDDIENAVIEGGA